MGKTWNRVVENAFSKVPGFVIALCIAIVAKFLEGIMPIPFMGASVMALFIGMIVHERWNPNFLQDGITFTSKKVLRVAIILLGASLSIGIIVEVGKISLIVMLFTLLTCFGGGYVVGKALGLNWKLSNLISAGTGICGGSAIAAIAPVIEAEDQQIAYAMSATFLFDMVMIVLFPIMGRWLNLSDMAYGLWAGTAVNDISSVVAAGFAYSEAAGNFATMVKLTRTLSIIPVVIVFAWINLRVKRKEMKDGLNVSKEMLDTQVISSRLNITTLFPWFIVFFLLLAVMNSFGFIPAMLSSLAKEISKFLMVMALAAIGLNTSLKEMRKSGIAPMVHGFIISALVVVVAILVEGFIGIV